MNRLNASAVTWRVLVLLLSLYFLLPLVWLIVSSTKSTGQLFTTFGLWFASPWHLLDNIRGMAAFQGGVVGRWMLNTAVYSGAVALLSTLFSAMAGYAFSRFEFPLKTVLNLMILSAVLLPITALVLPIFLILHDLGLINTYWAVILPLLVNPLGVYLMMIFWDQGFARELQDAAYLDGADEWRVFWQVGLPLVRNGLLTVALFSFVSTWNNFFLPLVVLSKGSLYPITLGLAIWNSTAQTGASVDYPAILVGALISVLPLIIAFFTLQRYWQAGLTSGSLK
ncbi:MAG: carbohydrate ABC transporter permease [Deinococcales bacterium]